MTITTGTEAFPLATSTAKNATSAARMRSVPTITRRRSSRSTTVPERIPSANDGTRFAMPRTTRACGPPPRVWNTSQVIAIAWNPSPTTDPACASQSRRKSGTSRIRHPGGTKRFTKLPSVAAAPLTPSVNNGSAPAINQRAPETPRGVRLGPHDDPSDHAYEVVELADVIEGARTSEL